MPVALPTGFDEGPQPQALPEGFDEGPQPGAQAPMDEGQKHLAAFYQRSLASIEKATVQKMYEDPKWANRLHFQPGHEGDSFYPATNEQKLKARRDFMDSPEGKSIWEPQVKSLGTREGVQAHLKREAGEAEYERSKVYMDANISGLAQATLAAPLAGETLGAMALPQALRIPTLLGIGGGIAGAELAGRAAEPQIRKLDENHPIVAGALRMGIPLIGGMVGGGLTTRSAGRLTKPPATAEEDVARLFTPDKAEAPATPQVELGAKELYGKGLAPKPLTEAEMEAKRDLEWLSGHYNVSAEELSARAEQKAMETLKPTLETLDPKLKAMLVDRVKNSILAKEAQDAAKRSSLGASGTEMGEPLRGPRVEPPVEAPPEPPMVLPVEEAPAPKRVRKVAKVAPPVEATPKTEFETPQVDPAKEEPSRLPPTEVVPEPAKPAIPDGLSPEEWLRQAEAKGLVEKSIETPSGKKIRQTRVSGAKREALVPKEGGTELPPSSAATEIDVPAMEAKVRAMAEKTGMDPEEAVAKMQEHLKGLREDPNLAVLGDVADSHVSLKTALAKGLKGRKGDAPILGDLLVDAVNVGRKLIQAGSDTFPKFTAKLQELYGDGIKPFIMRAWEALKGVWSKEPVSAGKGFAADRYQNLHLSELGDFGGKLEDQMFRVAGATGRGVSEGFELTRNAVKGASNKQVKAAGQLLIDDRLRYEQSLGKDINTNHLIEPEMRASMLEDQKVSDVYNAYIRDIAPDINARVAASNRSGVQLQQMPEGKAHFSLVRDDDPLFGAGSGRTAGERTGLWSKGFKKSGFAKGATGAGEAYDADIPSVVGAKLSDVYRNHEMNVLKDNLIRAAMEETGPVSLLHEGMKTPRVIEWEGKSYPGAEITVGSQRLAVPQRVAVAYNDITKPMEALSKEIPARVLRGAANLATTAALEIAPVEATAHGNRIYSIIRSIPGVGEDTAKKIVEGLPILRHADTVNRLSSGLDNPAEYDRIRKTLTEMAGMPTRVYDPRLALAEKLPIVGEIAGYPKRLVFGPGGLEERARVWLYAAHEQAYPEMNAAQHVRFANQLGNYSQGLQTDMVRFLKRNGINPFISFRASSIPSDVRRLFGVSGLGNSPQNVASTLMRGPLADFAEIQMLSQAFSGKFTWQNEDKNHINDVELPWRLKDGSKAYIPFNTLAPTASRALRVIGADAVIKSMAKGETATEASEKGLTQVGAEALTQVGRSPATDAARRLLSYQAGLPNLMQYGGPAHVKGAGAQLTEGVKSALLHSSAPIEASLGAPGYSRSGELIQKAVPGGIGKALGVVAQSVLPAVVTAGAPSQMPTKERITHVQEITGGKLTREDKDIIADAVTRMWRTSDPRDIGKIIDQTTESYKGDTVVRKYLLDQAKFVMKRKMKTGQITPAVSP